MSLLARFKVITSRWLVTGFACAALLLFVGLHAANAQQVVLDFRFDPSDPGYNASTPSTMTLAPSSAAQTFTVDIYATVVPAANTASTNLGLQSISMRGIDNGGNAFSTGLTGPGGTQVGVFQTSGVGNFAGVAPFNSAGFAQPKVSDLGVSTNGGSSVTTATANGIFDFGGTATANRLSISSATGALVYGGGASGSANTSTTPNGWQWLVGTFSFRTGTASANAGNSTQFLPLLDIASGQAGAVAFTATGAPSASTGPATNGSALTFTVASVSSGAIADNTNSPTSFTGSATTASVLHAASYAGTNSPLTGYTPSGSGSPAFGPTGSVTIGPGLIGAGSTLPEVATIVAGINNTANGGSGTANVSIAWRSRVTSPAPTASQETGGAGTAVPVSISTVGLVSDVVNLTGLSNATEGAPPSTQPTDPFVFQMVYNPNLLSKANHQISTENGLIGNSLLYLASLNTTSLQWEKNDA